jgi:hypothetical protein
VPRGTRGCSCARGRVLLEPLPTSDDARTAVRLLAVLVTSSVDHVRLIDRRRTPAPSQLAGALFTLPTHAHALLTTMFARAAVAPRRVAGFAASARSASTLVRAGAGEALSGPRVRAHPPLVARARARCTTRTPPHRILTSCRPLPVQRATPAGAGRDRRRRRVQRHAERRDRRGQAGRAGALRGHSAWRLRPGHTAGAPTRRLTLSFLARSLP